MTQQIARRAVLPTLAVFALVSSAYVHGYVRSGRRWASTQVSYYVNPSSKYLSANAAVAAVQQAAAGWNQQTQANIELVYAGTTNGSSVSLNNKNEAFYRNGSDGNSVGSTHTWWDSSNRLLDSDIVFYEGTYRFYYASGCSAQGIYAEDVAIHELGHLLGLSHSGVSGATMQAVMPGYCDRTQLTLEQDDINGLEAIYPPVNSTSKPTAPSQLNVSASTTSPTSSLMLSWVDNASNESGFRIERSTGSGFQQVAQVGSNVRTYTNTGLTSGTTYTYRVAAYNSDGSSAYSNTDSGQTATSTSNTAPAVTVANPVNGASYPQGATISFSGSATDNQDGNLTSGLRWVSNLSGQIGTGGSFSRTLTAGSHVLTASVTDSGGMAGTKQFNLTVSASATASAGATLTVRPFKKDDLWRAELNWGGFGSDRVDVYRNNVKVRDTENDGRWIDRLDVRRGTYKYKVCPANLTTGCSNEATATF